MFRASLEPVAVIATLQPTLLLWLSAIAFFVAVAVAAWMSKGRSWLHVVGLFAVTFVAVWIGSVGLVTWLTPVDVVEFELVSAGTRVQSR